MQRSTTFARLQHILADHFGKQPELLTPEASLRGTLMLDSLDLVDLVFFIGREFGIDATMEAYRDVRSLGALAALVEARGARAAA